MTVTEGRLRIGELARRTGASPAVLRAWEQRYGIIEPQRSPGGTRLYSERDEERIHTMQAHMADGLSAAQAARATLTGAAPQAAAPSPERRTARQPRSSTPPPGRSALRWHGSTANWLSDRSADSSLHSPSRRSPPRSCCPTSRMSARAEATIAEEHLATHVLHARLLALTHGFGPARGSRAVLACPPREQHDIALLMLAVALERRGWRIAMLGANTPIHSIVQAADMLNADCVVVSLTMPVELGDHRRAEGDRVVPAPAARRPAANDRLAQQIGATIVASDPITATAAFEDQLSPERPQCAAGAGGPA